MPAEIVTTSPSWAMNMTSHAQVWSSNQLIMSLLAAT